MASPRVRAETTHTAPLTWHSRGAPLSQRGAHAATWRERAAHHRAALGLRPEPVAVEAPPCRAEAVRGAEPEPVPEVAPREPPPEPAPRGEDEEEDGDLWAVALRTDLAQYVAYKNARLHAAALREGRAHVPCLERTEVWRVLLEVVAAERTAFRRHARSPNWPDTLLPAAAAMAGEGECVEPLAQLQRWVGLVEDAADRLHDEETRRALRELPVAALLRHGLADALVAAGDLPAAGEVLVRAVRTGPGPADPLDTPQLPVWEDHLLCNFARAHQCLRFGRLALLQAQALAAAEDDAYTAELRARRAAARAEAAQRGLQKARRQLLDARRLLRQELLEGPVAVSEAQTFGEDIEGWVLGIRCAQLCATALLGATLRELGRSDAEELLREACRSSEELQASAHATPRLRRLLAAERERLSAAVDSGAPSP